VLLAEATEDDLVKGDRVGDVPGGAKRDSRVLVEVLVFGGVTEDGERAGVAGVCGCNDGVEPKRPAKGENPVLAPCLGDGAGNRVLA
jgi:hypothetical protein